MIVTAFDPKAKALRRPPQFECTAANGLRTRWYTLTEDSW